MPLKKKPPEIALKLSLPRKEIAALTIEQKADLAYDVFGSVADALTDHGIDPDLVANAAQDLASDLAKLDGTPVPRVVRVRPKS